MVCRRRTGHTAGLCPTPALWLSVRVRARQTLQARASPPVRGARDHGPDPREGRGGHSTCLNARSLARRQRRRRAWRSRQPLGASEAYHGPALGVLRGLVPHRLGVVSSSTRVPAFIRVPDDTPERSEAPATVAPASSTAERRRDNRSGTMSFDQYLSFIRTRSPCGDAVFGSGANGQ